MLLHVVARFPVVIALLWLFLTAVAQALPKGTSSRFRLTASWVPEWRLFAPEPAKADYILIVRGKDDRGEVSSLHLCGPPPRRWSQAFWNPEGRQFKILRDMMEDLSRCMVQYSRTDSGVPVGVPSSAPYVALQTLAERQNPSRRIQFGILSLSWSGDGRPIEEIIFLSRWHEREKGG